MAPPPSTDTGPTPSPAVAAPEDQPAVQDDEVIRIEDLAPRENVKGGRKILLGEDVTRHARPL